MANARLQLANTIFTQGRYQEAQAHYVAALASNENNLGPDHPQTTTTRTGVAAGFVALGRNAEAIAELERALPLLRQSHGSDHSLVILNEGTLAIAMANLGRYTEAETSLREVIGKLERLFGALAKPSIVATRYVRVLGAYGRPVS